MKLRGPWSQSEVTGYLDSSRLPLRLAVPGRHGHPVLAALWFEPHDGRLWCATQRSALVARLIERDPRCAIEVSEQAMPYRGVRGPAVASLHPEEGPAVLRSLIARYLGREDSSLAQWLLARADDEVAIALEPQSWTSWDYGARMADAGAST